MAGYAATGRILSAHPRFVGSTVGWVAPLDRSDAATTSDRIEDDGPYAPPLDVRLIERWAQARQELAQVTFFLFDPNSWR